MVGMFSLSMDIVILATILVIRLLSVEVLSEGVEESKEIKKIEGMEMV